MRLISALAAIASGAILGVAAVVFVIVVCSNTVGEPSDRPTASFVGGWMLIAGIVGGAWLAFFLWRKTDSPDNASSD